MGTAVRDLQFANPSQGDSAPIHKIKIFDNIDVVTLETDVTAFVDSLNAPALPRYFIKDIQWSSYVNPVGTPELHHIVLVWYIWFE